MTSCPHTPPCRHRLPAVQEALCALAQAAFANGLSPVLVMIEGCEGGLGVASSRLPVHEEHRELAMVLDGNLRATALGFILGGHFGESLALVAEGARVGPVSQSTLAAIVAEIQAEVESLAPVEPVPVPTCPADLPLEQIRWWLRFLCDARSYWMGRAHGADLCDTGNK